MGKELEIKWAPRNEAEENACYQYYTLYVVDRKTVMQLAMEFRCTTETIKKRIRWAAIKMRDETNDKDLSKQFADTALLQHLRDIDNMIEEVSSVVHKVALMREKRLALMDLARIRGVLEWGDGRGREANVNIILPDINRGQGTAVIQEVGPQEIENG